VIFLNPGTRTKVDMDIIQPYIERILYKYPPSKGSSCQLFNPEAKCKILHFICKSMKLGIHILYNKLVIFGLVSIQTVHEFSFDSTTMYGYSNI